MFYDRNKAAFVVIQIKLVFLRYYIYREYPIICRLIIDSDFQTPATPDVRKHTLI